jgi:hypothetical protein
MTNDLKALKTLAVVALAALLTLAGVSIGRAVIIEGFTDTGDFASVFVSDQGELKVRGSSSVAMAVFFLSSQPVNAFQAGPWTFTPSAATTLSHNCTSMAGGATTLLIPAGATNRGGLICNQDASLNAWIGDASVNAANAPTLFPGACLTMDDGVLFTGALYAYTTAALDLCYYLKTP